MSRVASVVLPRIPELDEMGFPMWWHHHGMKMCVGEKNLFKRTVLLSGSAASLQISLHEPTTDGARRWKIQWEVRHSAHEKSTGVVLFMDNELELAFGLADEGPDIPVGHGWLFKRFGCDTARQRKFIRWRDKLNIPCPGTGHDGDPNVSVELDGGIQSCVRQLLDAE